LVIPHGCDSMVRSFSTWSYSLPYSYFHFVNIPSVCVESSFEFFNGELNTFKKGLEKFAGKLITGDDLAQAIRIYNENRDKVRALYGFRKVDPPVISGTELTMVLIVGIKFTPLAKPMSCLIRSWRKLGKEGDPNLKKPPVYLLMGPVLITLNSLSSWKNSEQCGGGYICNGARDYFPRTDEGGDPINALAHRYLDKINCPKTYRENKTGTFEGDIAARFGDIGAYAKEFKVDGAILYIYKYCDPFGFEVPREKPTINPSMFLSFIWRMSILQGQSVNSEPGSRHF